MTDREDNFILQKKLNASEANFKKEKALLEQKVELVKIELKEVLEREQNQNKMYETIIQALKVNSESQPNLLLQHLQVNKSIEADEIKDILWKYSNSADRLEQMLNSIKDNSNTNCAVEKLKKEHKSEIEIIKLNYERQIQKL